MIDLEEAKKIVLENTSYDTTIKSYLDYGSEYMFMVRRVDVLEGRFDPFIKVDKATGEMIDFLPQDYDNPLEILDGLNAFTE